MNRSLIAALAAALFVTPSILSERTVSHPSAPVVFNYWAGGILDEFGIKAD